MFDFSTRIGFVLLLILNSLSDSIASPEPAAQISVDIVNASSVELRCMIVFAHFVTRDLGPVAPGGVLKLSLTRNLDNGELSEQNDQRSMLLENILCASAGDWTKTVADLPVLPLRSSPGTRLHFIARCSVAKRLRCVLEPL